MSLYAIAGKYVEFELIGEEIDPSVFSIDLVSVPIMLLL
jgi:hypothetical protein